MRETVLQDGPRKTRNKKSGENIPPLGGRFQNAPFAPFIFGHQKKGSPCHSIYNLPAPAGSSLLVTIIWKEKDMGGPPKIGGNPQIIHLFIGFSMILTIHFGFFPPIFGNIHIRVLMKITLGVQKKFDSKISGCPVMLG